MRREEAVVGQVGMMRHARLGQMKRTMASAVEDRRRTEGSVRIGTRCSLESGAEGRGIRGVWIAWTVRSGGDLESGPSQRCLMWTENSYSWSWRRRHDRLVEVFTS